MWDAALSTTPAPHVPCHHTGYLLAFNGKLFIEIIWLRMRVGPHEIVVVYQQLLNLRATFPLFTWLIMLAATG